MSKLYQVRHVTRHRYENDVAESVMEVRKCPVARENQRVLSFRLGVDPGAKLFRFDEPNGNVVHHFDVPQPHRRMIIAAESLVEMKQPELLPAAVPADQWSALREVVDDAEFIEFVLPSTLVKPTDALRAFKDQVSPHEGEDPLNYLRRVSGEIARGFEYVPLSTQVDSPIDEALESKQGVCQDFAHILVGVARIVGIPARYVSGYLFHRQDGGDRSSSDASHAWVEAYLPALGWCGFDPTNNIEAGDRHIVTCVGRDYKDVPPTRGVYRGQSASELSVAVQVHPADSPHAADEFRIMDESDLRLDDWNNPEHQAQDQQ